MRLAGVGTCFAVGNVGNDGAADRRDVGEDKLAPQGWSEGGEGGGWLGHRISAMLIVNGLKIQTRLQMGGCTHIQNRRLRGFWVIGKLCRLCRGDRDGYTAQQRGGWWATRGCAG